MIKIMTKKNINEEEVTKNSIEEEESLDLDELQSVLSGDEGETIDSTDEEESPFQLLLKKGKNEGFITYAELNENLPEGVIEADRLEEIVEMISDMGISVQEHANKASNDENTNNDQETINPIENEIGKTTDPVRMYMREMGTIELLDRQGEIVIAKKIEDGNNKIQETLSSFLPVLIFIQERYRTIKEIIAQEEDKDNTKLLDIFSDYAFENDEIIEINSDNNAEPVEVDVAAIEKEIKNLSRQTNRLITLIEEVIDVIPNPYTLFGIVKEFRETNVEFIESSCTKSSGYSTWDDCFWVRVFTSQQNIGFSRYSCHLKSFEIKLPSQRIEVSHYV